MTLWQFAACVDGWNRTHGAEQDKIEPPTDSEFDALLSERTERLANQKMKDLR